MLTVKQVAELRKAIRQAVKATIWDFAREHKNSGLYIYDGNIQSVRFAIISDDSKMETCYDVSIKRLGRRRNF